MYLLYSCIFSRGIDDVQCDMDEPDNTLIAMHGYCTQVDYFSYFYLQKEMVNLMLLGQALSNVHDGDVSLGGDGPDVKVLKGPHTKSAIGMLSLFEHYRSIKARRQILLAFD